MRKIRRLLLKLFKPIIKFIGHIELPKKLITASDYYEIKKLVLPGDVLLFRKRFSLSNLLISGFWKHVGIYVCNDELDQPKMVEAIGKGVVVSSLLKTCLSYDYVCIVRALFCDAEKAKLAAINCYLKEGSDYDYGMDFSDDSDFACSELAAYGYNKAMGKVIFDKRDLFGELVVLPSDFYNAKKKFEVIYESRKCQ